MPQSIKVSDLVGVFHLEVVCGEEGLRRSITVADLHRPGLEMAGYFNFHPRERVHILGRTEITFYLSLSEEEQRRRAELLTSPDEMPCIVVTRGQEVPPMLIEEAQKRNLPILRSKMQTTILLSRITGYLEKRLAPSMTIHGVLVDVYGVGMLITGSSGIGKSETALELVKRGHRLVADDAVEIRQTEDRVLTGTAPELIRHLLEIRGVGIINMMTLFGAGAIRSMKKISVVVLLENWQPDKQYDRLGLDEEMTQIIDTHLPLVTIPVRPGRNIAVIIEVAAMNYRLKQMGYNAALQFTNKLTESLSMDMDEID